MKQLKVFFSRLYGRVYRELSLRRLLRNWGEVSRCLRSGKLVRRLELRKGVVLEGPESSNLDFLFAEIWINRVYSPPGYSLREGDVVIDIGANIGVFSAYAALQARGVTVYAYEPFPENASLLRSNLAGIEGSTVKVFEQAVADSTGFRTLKVDPANWIVHSVAYADSVHEGISVDCVSLDEVFERNRIEKCNLLKIDCEGAEYEILKSVSPGTLLRVEKIVGEYHPCPGEFVGQSSEELLGELLGAHGFTDLAIQPFGGDSGGIFHARRPGSA